MNNTLAKLESKLAKWESKYLQAPEFKSGTPTKLENFWATIKKRPDHNSVKKRILAELASQNVSYLLECCELAMEEKEFTDLLDILADIVENEGT